MNDEVLKVSMEIILNAGDARTILDKSLLEAEKGNIELANELILQAREKIVKAHCSQTAFIQEEASGKTHEFSVLFTHAQDTMMTIQTEIRLAQHIINILNIIYNGKNV